MYSLGAKYTTAKFLTRQYLAEKAEGVKQFFRDERGDTTIIAIILVLVVVIALAVVFRKNIVQLANGIWTKVFGNADLGDGASQQQMTDGWDAP